VFDRGRPVVFSASQIERRLIDADDDRATLFPALARTTELPEKTTAGRVVFFFASLRKTGGCRWRPGASIDAFVRVCVYAFGECLPACDAMPRREQSSPARATGR
jgi:hypothetical protein